MVAFLGFYGQYLANGLVRCPRWRRVPCLGLPEPSSPVSPARPAVDANVDAVSAAPFPACVCCVVASAPSCLVRGMHAEHSVRLNMAPSNPATLTQPWPWPLQSPVDALIKHVQNPALYNFTTNGVSLPEQAHPLLKCARTRSWSLLYIYFAWSLLYT